LKRNSGETYEFVYNQLESLKITSSNLVLPILEFCQECITDCSLKYLPNDIELRKYAVIFLYEEDNGDHLLISFNKQGLNFDDEAIECLSFKSDTITSYHDLSWNKALQLINSWFIS
jgi:hypothetical protein